MGKELLKTIGESLKLVHRKIKGLESTLLQVTEKLKPSSFFTGKMIWCLMDINIQQKLA